MKAALTRSKRRLKWQSLLDSTGWLLTLTQRNLRLSTLKPRENAHQKSNMPRKNMSILKILIRQRVLGIIRKTQTNLIPRPSQPSMMMPLSINRDPKRSQGVQSMWRIIRLLPNRKNHPSIGKSSLLRKPSMMVMAKSNMQNSIQANREVTRLAIQRAIPSNSMINTIKSMMKKPIRKSIQGIRHAQLPLDLTPLNRERLTMKLTITERSHISNIPNSSQRTHQARRQDTGRSPIIMRLRNHFMKRSNLNSSSDRRRIMRRTMLDLNNSRGTRRLESMPVNTPRERDTRREPET